MKVRRVTALRSNWSSQGNLENDRFSYRLILDNGAEEPDHSNRGRRQVRRDFFADAGSIH